MNAKPAVPTPAMNQNQLNSLTLTSKTRLSTYVGDSNSGGHQEQAKWLAQRSMPSTRILGVGGRRSQKAWKAVRKGQGLARCVVNNPEPNYFQDRVQPLKRCAETTRARVKGSINTVMG